jgi:hypothetical protein
MEPTTWDNVGQHYTADGVLIVPGLRIVNYDRRADTVIEPVRYGNPAEPQWFVTEHGIFDGSRMQAARPTDSGPAGPTWAKPCEKCGQQVERWRGQGDVSCSCGAWYNAGGQRLRDDWAGNLAWRDDEVDDLEGFERQQLAKEEYL